MIGLWFDVPAVKIVLEVVLTGVGLPLPAVPSAQWW